MTNKFRRDYGVICCPHVFNNQRPALLVVRDPEGYWQFLCGQPDEDFEHAHHVGVGHLLSRDVTLEEMVDLEVASGAKRAEIDANWEYFIPDWEHFDSD